MRGLARIFSYYYSTSNRGEAYSADQVDDLMFWYDMSQEIGYIDGDKIQTVNDFSWNGRHITQSTDLNKATYKTNILNSKPILRFAAAQHYVPVNGVSDVNWMHQGDSTLFFVVKQNIDNATNVLFDSANSTRANVGRTIQFAATAKINDQVTNGSAVCYTNTTPNNSTPKDTWLVIVIRLEQAKTIEESTIEVNNVLKGVSSQTAEFSESDCLSTVKWFRRASSISPFNGDIAEWFGYNRALTDDEIAGLVGGINSSYGN